MIDNPDDDRDAVAQRMIPRPHAFILLSDAFTGDYPQEPAWYPYQLWSTAQGLWGGQGRKKAAETLLRGAGAQQLWAKIASKYEHAEMVAAQLPEKCEEALEAWRVIPKEPQTEWQKSQEGIERKAHQLATEMERYLDRWDWNYGDPPRDFYGLLSEQEQAEAARRISALHGPLYVHETWELLLGDDRGVQGIVPDLPEMLRRIGKLFGEESKRVYLERPTGANAERNYFARRIIEYFRKSHREGPSPAIVASIVSLFFQQGMDAADVQAQLNALPSGRRIPKEQS
jgi:hypothetical protein